MIGMDRKTGKTISGYQQLISRITQVMTTSIGSREKRRKFGSRVPETLAKNMSNHQLMLTQVYAIEAFYNPENGLFDFIPTQCVASRHENGIRLAFSGTWLNNPINLEIKI